MYKFNCISPLLVAGIPVFTASLTPITIQSGGIATLDCQVISNPPATITWLYELGSVTRVVTTGGRVIISPAHFLTILNVRDSDAGYYVCSAQNVFGINVTSARLQVGSM